MILTAPSLLPIIHRLRQLFQAQWQEVRVRLPGAIRTGRALDLRHWNDTFYRVMLPIMQPQWQVGLAQGRRQMDAAGGWAKRRTLEGIPANNHVMKVGCAKMRTLIRKDVSWLRTDTAFSLHNPAVAQAIADATFTFCKETNATATRDLNEAIAALRGELAEGIERGEAFTDLGRRVQTLFADQSRAYLIAETETTRALAGGSVISYQREGAEGVEWLTTSDPCPRCERLNGEQRAFGEPFDVDSKGGPYAVCYHPPLHPHCYCTVVPVI